MFGALMQMMGMMEMVGKLVGQNSAAIGWPVHLLISALIGAGYGFLLGQVEHTWARGAGLGLVYGALWWVLGALLLMPAQLGMPVFQLSETALMSLMGHLVFGVVTGLVFTAGIRQTTGELITSR